MSLTLVEAPNAPIDDLIDLESSLPFVIVVPETAHDVETRHEAGRFIGAVALGETVDFLPERQVHKPIESLFEAIHLAVNGDTEEVRQQARKLVETNVRTDVIERTIKSGHVLKVGLVVGDDGKIKQHGQSMDSVQANSLRFASGIWQMRERTEAETRNAFRIDKYYKDGTLDDYSLVVISRAADNMTAKEMKDAGFFTDTMSCAVQVTTASEDGLTTESAFIAGVYRPGGERHDAETIGKFGDLIGADFKGKGATETLDTPVLILKKLIPNGASDVVKMIDSGAGTFYGEDKPQQDYLEYLELCKQREQTYEPKVQQIVGALLAEADRITSQVMATERLNKISEKHMVEKAIDDENINPLVFGEESAGHINQARVYRQQGNFDGALLEMSKAVDTAKSYSCPSGGSSPATEGGSNKESSYSDDYEGDCEYISGQCPLCLKKNVKTLVTKYRVTCDSCKGFVKK